MGIITVVGGQYGSEGKGVIADRFSSVVTGAVRTGGPNAGHSIIHEDRVWKMRSIPVAWTNPRATLLLGPGAIIDQHVLYQEVGALEQAGYNIRDRLFIDHRATIITESDSILEQRRLVDSIGSTGKGIGAARIRRIERDKTDWIRAEDVLQGFLVADTSRMIHQMDLRDEWVLLEGTQGFGLSLTYGPWPYVTSADCTVQQLCNDAGIMPIGPTLTVLVFRSHPIRVAGNSGPLIGEMTWDDMSAKLGRPVIEHTTVTGKVRRVGQFDWELAQEAVRINQPDTLALTFTDYIDPLMEAQSDAKYITPLVRSFINEMEDRLNVPIGIIGTGGPKWSTILLDAADPLVHSWDAGLR